MPKSTVLPLYMIPNDEVLLPTRYLVDDVAQPRIKRTLLTTAFGVSNLSHQLCRLLLRSFIKNLQYLDSEITNELNSFVGKNFSTDAAFRHNAHLYVGHAVKVLTIVNQQLAVMVEAAKNDERIDSDDFLAYFEGVINRKDGVAQLYQSITKNAELAVILLSAKTNLVKHKQVQLNKYNEELLKLHCLLNDPLGVLERDKLSHPLVVPMPESKPKPKP